MEKWGGIKTKLQTYKWQRGTATDKYVGTTNGRIILQSIFKFPALAMLLGFITRRYQMNKKSKKWVKREKQRRDVAWTIACWFLRRTIWYWLNMTNRGDGGVGCLIYNSRPPGFINSHAHPSEQNSFQHILPALLLPRHKPNIE